MEIDFKVAHILPAILAKIYSAFLRKFKYASE